MQLLHLIAAQMGRHGSEAAYLLQIGYGSRLFAAIDACRLRNCCRLLDECIAVYRGTVTCNDGEAEGWVASLSLRSWLPRSRVVRRDSGGAAIFVTSLFTTYKRMTLTSYYQTAPGLMDNSASNVGLQCLIPRHPPGMMTCKSNQVA
jgi:hypothetical protein